MKALLLKRPAAEAVLDLFSKVLLSSFCSRPHPPFGHLLPEGEGIQKILSPAGAGERGNGPLLHEGAEVN